MDDLDGYPQLPMRRPWWSWSIWRFLLYAVTILLSLPISLAANYAVEEVAVDFQIGWLLDALDMDQCRVPPPGCTVDAHPNDPCIRRACERWYRAGGESE